MITCKEFLDELNNYLDESTSSEVRRELEEHLNECPNCWVICDTAKKTIKVYRGFDPYPLPKGVHERLMAALQKRIGAH